MNPKLIELLEKAEKDIELGKLSRREFGQWIYKLSIASGISLLELQKASAWVSTRMRKSKKVVSAPTTFLSKVGAFNTGTSAVSSLVSVTGVGFQPKAILFWWSGRTETSDAVSRESERFGFGWATGTTSRACCYTWQQDSTSSWKSGRNHRTDACIGLASSEAATDGLLDLDSFDADGFTLRVDDQFSSDFRIHYQALGGSDLTDVATGVFQEAGPGNFDVTGVGFQPDCALFLSSGISTAPSPHANSSYSVLSLGAAVSSSQLATINGLSVSSGGDSKKTATYSYNGELWSNITIGAPVSRIGLTSFLPDGFRFNCFERSGSRYIFYLALKGGRYSVGNLQTTNDTSDISVSGLSIGKPSGALFFSNCYSESSQDTTSTNKRYSIGAASSGASRSSVALFDKHNSGTSQVATATRNSSVYTRVSDTNTIDAEMDIKSFDVDGFTCKMTTTNPSAATVHFLAFGESS